MSQRWSGDTARPVARRYELINEIGRGGMSLVYRALDRFTGGIVTLKRLRQAGHRGDDSPGGLHADRLLLANEFRLMASLRHPNIITVLDYGFDEGGRPFLTMDLQERATTILEAGQGRSLAVQVDLLVQVLRALAYLGRQGVIHRDLKPSNVIVVEDQVKLLDFGISILREAAEADTSRAAGTLAYLAPELLRGGAPSVRSDLYAFGILAYELLVGRRPFIAHGDRDELYRHVIEAEVVFPADGQDTRMEPVIRQLLAKDPEERHERADDVIEALGAAVGKPLAIDTATSRESFLQAARFVGRDAEMDDLSAALGEALEGRGSVWLIEGESGVGKSRLLEELRIEALVRGAVVLQGQTISKSGEPYHAWRGVVRDLVLLAGQLDERLASNLVPLVPDIDELLGRPVPAPPLLEVDAAQVRLLLAVQELMKRQSLPCLVIIEDLHWAGSESLQLLESLARTAQGRRQMIVGSYRDEEWVEAREAVPRARRMRIGRLSREEVASLALHMLGPPARRQDLIDLLVRETEGIPFFLVEVVRALAEEAGGLERVGVKALPGRIAAGGMQRLIHRRLERVPDPARFSLRVAAVIGREIERDLLQAVDPHLDFEQWSGACIAAGVLEPLGESLRFAHDKLREKVLSDMAQEQARELHGRVARAIEQSQEGADRFVQALAHHWREAGDQRKEAVYAEKAGFAALASGAYKEAVAYFERTLALLTAPGKALEPAGRGSRAPAPPDREVDPKVVALRLSRLDGGITEAYFHIGDMARCCEHAVRSMRRWGRRVPASGAGLALGSLWQLVRMALRRLLPARTPDPLKKEAALHLTRVAVRKVESHFFAQEAGPSVWTSLLMVNMAAPMGPSAQLALAYLAVGILAGMIPIHPLARAWCRRSQELAEQCCSQGELAHIIIRLSLYWMSCCEWETADALQERAADICETIGNHNVLQEGEATIGMACIFQSRLERGYEAFRSAWESARRGGSGHYLAWALAGQAEIRLRQGLPDEACDLLLEAIEAFGDQASETGKIWTQGSLALAHLRRGEPEEARSWADRTFTLIEGVKPVAYWTQSGYAAVATVYIELAEAAGQAERAELLTRARKACAAMGAFARRFDLGKPFDGLLDGRRAWLLGRRRRAYRRWRRCVSLARRLQTPYEEGLAHLYLGRHLPERAQERVAHLERAVEVLDRVGAAHDLALAEAALREIRGAADREAADR